MRIIDRICLILVLCFYSIGGIYAESTHWSYDERAYQYDMTVYFSISVDGITLHDMSDYEIAAFCGDECRGIGQILTVEKNDQTVTYGYLRIRSNQQVGENIMFKAYKKSTNRELAIEHDPIVFGNLTVLGFPSSPILLVVNLILGDVNGDGDVTAQDASLVLQAVAGKIEFSAEQRKVADVNEDGEITAQDASLILQYVAGKIIW